MHVIEEADGHRSSSPLAAARVPLDEHLADGRVEHAGHDVGLPIVEHHVGPQEAHQRQRIASTTLGPQSVRLSGVVVCCGL